MESIDNVHEFCKMNITDIVGEYLRGYMFVDEVVIDEDDIEENSVYLFFEDFEARMFYQDVEALLHSTEWSFEIVNDAPDRDSRYKAIGEKIKEIVVGEKEFENAVEPTTYVQIKTATKVLNFMQENFDGCYETNIWEVI